METQTKPSGVISAGGILDRIVEAKASRLERAKRRTPIELLAPRALAMSSSRGRSLAGALRQSGSVNVIAEIKKSSPSKGVICKDFDPVRIAVSYASGGAAALSVLCEEDFFEGSLAHLELIRGAVDLPLLRKDFIFDPYHLYEARAAGADAVLLIVAILNDERLTSMIGLANELGLAALVEVHTADEMGRATRSGASLVGVNNRDLTTFAVEIDTSIRLAPLAPKSATLVSESGINTGSDIRRLRSAGFNAFLVGEHLMREPVPGDALKRLIKEVA